MKLYLKYLLSKKLLQTIVMAMIPSFILIITLLSSSLDRNNYGMVSYDDPLIFNLSVVLMMIIVTIIVIFRFGSLRNEKEVDLFYALPISRKDLFLSHYLFGLLQAVIVWTSIFLLGLIALNVRYPFIYQFKYFLFLYMLVILFILIIYTLSTFAFLRAKNIIDGIAFIILFQLFFLSLSFAFNVSLYVGFSSSFIFNPFYALSLISTSLMRGAGLGNSGYGIVTGSDWIMIIINLIIFISLGICMFIYDLKNIESQKTEYIGSISSSKLGYLFYIPSLLFLLTLSTFNLIGLTSYLMFVILMSAGFIGFFIYRRSVKIKPKDLIFIFVPMFAAIIFSFLIR
ncbi:MAG: hypothetical protein K8Q99_08045 [Acholeplasmataceae bacterium]|nr:hypothetical protein [Acholeplasmataceae bacterium]